MNSLDPSHPLTPIFCPQPPYHAYWPVKLMRDQTLPSEDKIHVMYMYMYTLSYNELEAFSGDREEFFPSTNSKPSSRIHIMAL